MYCISYDSIPDSVFKPLDGAVVKDGHTLYKGEFRADEKGETFVSLKGFTRGNIFINGFNLGRYFACGPHKTVYLPSPLIKTGKNEIVVTDCRGGQTSVPYRQAGAYGQGSNALAFFGHGFFGQRGKNQIIQCVEIMRSFWCDAAKPVLFNLS